MSTSPPSPRSVLRRCASAAGVLFAATGLVLAGPLLTANAEPPVPDAAPVSKGVNAIGMSPNVDLQVAIIRENEAAAFSFFMEKGLTAEQAAGVIGNLDQESGMDPAIHQIGGGPGRGIAQWSAGGRWDTYAGDNLVEFTAGGDRYSLQVQLDFIWYELTAFSYYGLTDLQAANTVEQAVVAFQDDYEGCGTCHTDRRIAFALDAYGLYA